MIKLLPQPIGKIGMIFVQTLILITSRSLFYLLKGFLKDQAEAAISFYIKVLQEEVFDRDEFKEMAELGLMILDQTQAYKIYRPYEPNSARFLNSGLKYQKLFLLMKQFPNLVSKHEFAEVNAMAEFASIFYGVWFLTFSLASAAPANDIHAVW